MLLLSSSTLPPIPNPPSSHNRFSRFCTEGTDNTAAGSLFIRRVRRLSRSFKPSTELHFPSNSSSVTTPKEHRLQPLTHCLPLHLHTASHIHLLRACSACFKHPQTPSFLAHPVRYSACPPPQSVPALLSDSQHPIDTTSTANHLS